ncbi:hypothetical protein D3C85_1666810 [compost metagenome]
MDVTLADLAVECFIVEYRATRFMQLGNQVPVGGVRRRIRQYHAGQRVEVAQAGAGQFQPQVQRAKVQGIGQGAGQLYAGVGNLHLSLQWKLLGRVLQRQ